MPIRTTTPATALALLVPLLLAGCADDAAPTPPPGPEAPAGTPSAPPAPADPGAAPHVHDLWEGRERITLLEADYEVQPPEAAAWTAMSTLWMGEPAAGGFFVDLPEGALVPEGTGRLEVLATWTDPTVTGLRFLYRHAGSGDIEGWVAAPQGEAAAVEVTPPMTDMPHARSTRWAFLFSAAGTPAAAVGSVHLRLDVVRTRDPALWPGHPDLWGNATRLTRLDAEGATRTALAPTPLPAPGEAFAPPRDAVPLQAPVPMETTVLAVQVDVLSVSPATRPLERLRLLVRTASHLQFDFEETDVEPAASPDGLSWTWRVPVRMADADSPYAEGSAWALLVDPDYGSPAPVPLPLPCECHEAELRYRVRAEAVRAPPAEPAATL